MIDILMAVYNGEKYLAEQIESILAQTAGDWKLFIRDDGSKDTSFDIALEYAEKYPKLIEVSRNELPTGSARGNFMEMLKNSSSEYVMFSDQDDHWHPDKIKLTLDKMRELEGDFPESPVLVHTELEIADSELNVISPSFTRYQGLDPQCKGLNRLLCQNNITGCTVMMNKALVSLVKGANHDDMLMHDWWAGLAAAAFGHIGFVETPLIKYRQHGGNQVGAVKNGSLSGIIRVIKNRAGIRKGIQATYYQAEKFLGYYSTALSDESRQTIKAYIEVNSDIKPVRIIKLVRYGYLKQTFAAAAGQLIFC